MNTTFKKPLEASTPSSVENSPVQFSETAIQNMIKSGDINYHRRKQAGRQMIFTSERSRNPFYALIKVRKIFEKYEKPKDAKNRKTDIGK